MDYLFKHHKKICWKFNYHEQEYDGIYFGGSLELFIYLFILVKHIYSYLICMVVMRIR